MDERTYEDIMQKLEKLRKSVVAEAGTVARLRTENAALESENRELREEVRHLELGR